MSPAKRILAVDEDSKTISLIREALKGHRYSLQVATAAEEALDIMERDNVDLVICGTRVGGADFLSELRDWDTNLPIILLNENGKEKDWLEAFQAHVSSMISKPFKKDVILKSILRAFNEKETIAAS